MSRVTLGVLGASGRMGQAVISVVDDRFHDRALVAAKVSTSSGSLDDFGDVDVVIDVSLPGGTSAVAGWIDNAPRKPILVSGTTGLDERMLARLSSVAQATIILHSSNFSPGVAAMRSILRYATPLLSKLGYVPAITESHHRHKVDAPSGTARDMLKIVGDEVKVSSIREGEIIGRHEIGFRGQDDDITLIHDAKDRSLFARGAVDAAIWLAKSAPVKAGLLSMDDYMAMRYLNASESDQPE